MSLTAGGKRVLLGKQLGSAGGEGTVYAVSGEPKLVAKVLHGDKRTAAREAKLKAMVGRKPANRTQRVGTAGTVPTIAWPEELLYENGRFAGFLMPALDLAKTVEIGAIENPARRQKREWTKRLGLGARAHLARNLAFLTRQVHSVDAVIGDFNHRNVMVSDTGIVTIIDCDSMQVQDASGRYHFCGVFLAGYWAPELHGADLSQTVRAPHSDLFVLAVHIYYLLLERHPFENGVYRGKGEKPHADILASAGQWRGRKGGVLAAIEPKAVDPALLLTPSLQELFRRAFESGAAHASARPSAREWEDELGRFIGDWKPGKK